jgi:hypothetical protein
LADPFRDFPPDAPWSDPKTGRLTPLADGWRRRLFDYVGAREGVIPITSIGGDGVSTTTFLRSDGTYAVPDYPIGANPTAEVGTTATNGSANTFMRSDAAPAISQSIAPTWSGLHTFNAGIQTTSLMASTTIRSTGGFGCNGAGAQASAVVNAAVAGTAGAAYTAAEQAILNNAVALVNQLRALLVANGQAV